MTKKQMKRTILIVEDEAALADIYSTELKRSGYSVLLATDGIEGLSLAVEHRPDAVLLDILLPKKDGFSLLADIKGNSLTAAIPVIVLSNLAREYEKARGEKLGASRFYTKTDLTPMNVVQEIAEVIKEAEKITVS